MSERKNMKQIFNGCCFMAKEELSAEIDLSTIISFRCDGSRHGTIHVPCGKVWVVADHPFLSEIEEHRLRRLE